MSSSDTAKTSRAEYFLARHSFWIGLSVVAAAFVAGAVLTWRKWPDLIIDFGLQLYIPWRLANGAVLYSDLYYMAGGPLSQYYHAALFKLFGTSFLTLIISNLVITAGMLFLIYKRFRQAAGTLTATLIALSVVVGFAFAQYTGVGNYNYLAPYSHEILHGLALSILTLTLLSDWLAREKIWLMVPAGICTGLVALTKPDMFLALFLNVLVAFGLAWLRKNRRDFLIKSSAVFVLAALVPPIGFFLFFLQMGNWQESLRLEFFGWRPLFIKGVVNDSFYQWCLGLDTPFEHIRQSSLYFLIGGLVIAIYALLLRQIRNLTLLWRSIITVTAILVLVALATRFNWTNCGAALPLLGLVAIGILCAKWRQESYSPRIIFPLFWTIYSILLLAKQGVFPRIWQTGFVLAMPAFVSAVYLLLRLLPEALESRYRIPRLPMRFGTLAIVLVALVSLANTSRRFYSTKNLPVGHGPDLMLANGPTGNSVEARNFNLALDWIETNVPPSATIAALPEGVMLNYLSRRVNPAPCLDWNPTFFAVYGTKQMTDAFEQNAPDYIALVEWQTYEFDVGYFGSPNYGGDVMNWIHEHYRPVALFGSEPLKNGLFGIKILKRNPENSRHAKS